MDNNKNLPPLLLDEYEKYIREMMEEFDYTKEEAIQEMERHIQELMIDLDCDREEAIMAALEGW